MNLSDPTPNEVQAAIISDLEAKLSLASEREFYIKAENARLRERSRVLREALENLCDEQNGPPLCTREEEWKQAMEKADAALAATEGKL